MKKFDLGRSLSKTDQQKIMGGVEDGCSVSVSCPSGHSTVSCSGSRCSISRNGDGREDGVTCDGVSTCC
jgi:hypothetical protein